MNKSCNCPYVYNYDVNIEVLYYLYDIIITYTIISVIYKTYSTIWKNNGNKKDMVTNYMHYTWNLNMVTHYMYYTWNLKYGNTLHVLYIYITVSAL